MTDRSIQDIEEMGGAKYINPYTDFGFKKLFGTPLNKDLLISFLNSLFEGKEVVKTYISQSRILAMVLAIAVPSSMYIVRTSKVRVHC